jgi:hypothetical protein
MEQELQQLTEWIPEQMGPGTIFILENDGKVASDDPADPYWAVLACPGCGTLGYITRQQIAGLRSIMCGSTECSCELFISNRREREIPFEINDMKIVFRKPS